MNESKEFRKETIVARILFKGEQRTNNIKDKLNKLEKIEDNVNGIKRKD